MSQLSAAFNALRNERLAVLSGPEQFQGEEIAGLTVAEIKRRINRWIYHQTDGVVQSGPFAGMRLLQDSDWAWNDDLSTRIIGCYEQELHHYIELEIYRLGCLPNPKIVNIGSAEGYYAVGMARRLPLASVWIVDVSEGALKCAEKAAAANDVTLQARNPIETVLSKPDLVVCDCEGAEPEYLDKQRFPDLAQATIMVECHDFNEELPSRTITERFEDSHMIWAVREAGRDPNRYPFMHLWHSTARWLAISEGRPWIMRWLLLRPKT